MGIRKGESKGAKPSEMKKLKVVATMRNNGEKASRSAGKLKKTRKRPSRCNT